MNLKLSTAVSLAGLLMFSGTALSGNVASPASNTAKGPTVQEILATPVNRGVAQPATPVRPTAPVAALPAATAATNPQKSAEDAQKEADAKKYSCEAFQASPSAYAICQDRMEKIKRMREAQGERAALSEAARKPRGPGSAKPGTQAAIWAAGAGYRAPDMTSPATAGATTVNAAETAPAATPSAPAKK